MDSAKWTKLVPLGHYDHQKGVQVVDRESAEKMINYFNSLHGKLMRKFLGLPIYVGHPDDPECGSAQDKSVYGHVENLKIEGDALWILPHWTELGKKLFHGGFLRHLSPRWMMRKIGDKMFQPIRLISIGLTNRPNLHHGDGQREDPSAERCDDCQPQTKNVVAINGTENQNLDGIKIGEIHLNSLTGDLFKRRQSKPRRDQILALVYERMANFGADYQSAWTAVKRDNPTLFEENF